jgi:tetratricopeptide (TPR) repeat protein
MRLVPAAEERKYQEIDALIKKGSQFLDAEQYEDAKVIYDQLLKSYPYHFGAYVNRGNCHLHMERYQQAIADYLRAIEIDPNLRIAYANLATAYKKTDQYQLALETYRTFLSRLPLNAKDDIELVKKWIVEVEAKISRSKGSVKWKNRRKKGETNGPSSSSVCNKTTS